MKPHHDTDISPAKADSAWEAAYARFETPAEEVRKFRRRLLNLGADKWSRDAEIVELFCGRGNGLVALAELGFQRLEGVDLSPTLVAQYTGKATCYVSDCRQLPFPDKSKDRLIVQGGLHHLSVLPGDLDQTLSEARRVLRPAGLFVVIEPWLTPFLQAVHALCDRALVRRLSAKVDALATMIDHERETYEQWLNQPDLVVSLFNKHFNREQSLAAWGKYSFVGSPKPR